jgi:hypothetical protein
VSKLIDRLADATSASHRYSVAQEIAAAIRQAAPGHGPVCHAATICRECARADQAEKDAQVAEQVGGVT